MGEEDWAAIFHAWSMDLSNADLSSIYQTTLLVEKARVDRSKESWNIHNIDSVKVWFIPIKLKTCRMI